MTAVAPFCCVKIDLMKHLLFLGIAGHAMGGLALAAQNRGFTVSGLDEGGGPPMSDWLDKNSLKWSKVYDPSQLDGVDAIVLSGQHGKDDHPMIALARERNIRLLSFAELVGELTNDKHVIAVAGTHGKTTTTSLITWLLESAGQKPDYLIGIRPFNFEASSRLDGADKIVIEADEYKASTMDPGPKFRYYHPNKLVLTSVEHDHPDVYPTMESYLKVFTELVKGLPKTGGLVACIEDENVRLLIKESSAPVTTYGFKNADFIAKNVEFNEDGIKFEVIKKGENLGAVNAGVYGRHNVLNSLAAVAIALGEDISFEQIQKGAPDFKGAFRRFNILTPKGSSVTVIDDYAHHPAEVTTTIEAARLHFKDRRLVVIYRPHTYSRTQTLLKEYHQAFTGADKLYMCDVEPARELANQRTVSGQEIVDGLPDELKANSVFEQSRDNLVKQVLQDSKPGDVILSMTVSGYDNLANELAQKI